MVSTTQSIREKNKILQKQILELRRTNKQLLAEIRKLKSLAYEDHLTGLLNRRGFLRLALPYFQSFITRNKIKKRRKEKRSQKLITDLTIIFLDIDDFKKINDKFGHKVGDKVLRKIGKVLKSSIRRTDIVARWGGEEFVILLLNTPYNKAKIVARKILQKIRSLSLKSLKGTLITVSIGVVRGGQEGNFQELIKKADLLMYQAKKQGKNRAVFSKR